MDLSLINAELKALKIGVAIEIRGDKLYLRANLPPKPSSKRRSPHQQRISLGINANDEGLKRAKAQAIKLSGLIACNEFDWFEWIDNEKLTCKEWCDRFKRDYFARRANTPQSRTTYRSNYQQIFNKLPGHRRLTANLLKNTLLAIAPDTKQRQRGTVALSKLAEFAGLSVNLQRYKGNYSHASAKRVSLPSDQQLIDAAKAIPSAEWRNFVLILITYGLRPHEGFYAVFGDDSILYVADGKTGDRHVPALYPEWFEHFDLANAVLPPGGVAKSIRDFSALGDRVTTQFRRYSIPFTSYVPRHSYARRSKDFGISAVDAAKIMGHSLETHFKHYHRHYAKDDVIRVSQAIEESKKTLSSIPL